MAVKGNLTVALDISLSEALLKEGNARELVNRVQNIRKEANFELTDKILLQIVDNQHLKESINEFSKAYHHADGFDTSIQGIEFLTLKNYAKETLIFITGLN